MSSSIIQCPQCGAVSSSKLSETEYHCVYCDCSFTVGMTKEEMIAKLLNKSGNTKPYSDALQYRQEKLAAMSEEARAALKVGKKRALIFVFIFFGFIIGVCSIVYISVHKAATGISDIVNNVIVNSTVSKFKVFSGSKGPVIWMLQEQSASMNDSTHYILSIIDPPSKKHLKDIEYIPAMTWSDAFNSNKYIGDFYAFGDTCWIVSEQYGLTARDIYTGKIIIDAQKLCKMHTELQKGITKAEWGYSNRYFSIMTNDGYEFIFLPDQNKIFKKDDYDENKRDDGKMVTRNFFVLSDSKRPELYLSNEKTSPFATSSKLYSHLLENFDPKNRPFGMSDDIISATHILPDLIFFNGFILYSDNDKTLIAYQNTVAKDSPLHISCIGANGKIIWNIAGKEVQAFEQEFSGNNRAIDFAGSKNIIALFTDYGDHDAIGVDWKDGKILWQFTTKKSEK